MVVAESIDRTLRSDKSFTVGIDVANEFNSGHERLLSENQEVVDLIPVKMNEYDSKCIDEEDDNIRDNIQNVIEQQSLVYLN